VCGSYVFCCQKEERIVGFRRICTDPISASQFYFYEGFGRILYRMVERYIGQLPQQTITREIHAKAVEAKKRNAFKESASQAFHIAENPELELAALTISRMRGVSFEDRWHTFVYWIWFNDARSFNKFGLSEKEAIESFDAVKESGKLHLMLNITKSVVDAKRKSGDVQLPNRYDIKMIYRKALVERYLKVLQDGYALGYKQIAALMSEELGESITVQNVNHIVRLLRDEGKAERRYLSKEQVMELKGKIKELRNNTEESVGSITGMVGQSPSRVESVIKHLIRDEEIANKNPRTPDDTRNLLLKIFGEYRQRFPGKIINLTDLARQLGITRRVVTSHYHKYEATNEVPPISVSWRTSEKIDFLSLLNDTSKPQS